MDRFFGRFQNLLDAKGRVNLPVRFREMVERAENGDQVFIVTRGTEKYVVLFPIDEWRHKLEELEQKVDDGESRRILIRRMHYHASPQKVDKQGRINIPVELIRYAGLEREVAVMGTGKRIEIWNPERLDTTLEKNEDKYQEHSKVLDF